jgi:hypothetical protein
MILKRELFTLSQELDIVVLAHLKTHDHFAANRTEADYQEWREQKWFHRRVTASLTMLLDRCRCDNGTARG